ncbi:hypothetical protein ACU4GD_12040 [Cupriavidus basilensis]
MKINNRELGVGERLAPAKERRSYEVRCRPFSIISSVNGMDIDSLVGSQLAFARIDSVLERSRADISGNFNRRRPSIRISRS